MNVETIIALCGGSGAIVTAVRKSGREITVRGVLQWKKRGIPSWHWKAVMGLSGVTSDQILYANALIKKQESSGPLAVSAAA